MKQGNETPDASMRTAGILLHVTSLPGNYGIGDLGASARTFIDQLARAGQTWWQLLPLGPPGAGQSPYQCYSAFAGNPLLISLDALVEDGLLERRDVQDGGARPESPGAGRRKKSDAGVAPARRVDFPHVERLKLPLLHRAWEAFRGGRGRKLRNAYEQFVATESSWLDDFALFMSLRALHPRVDWQDWPGAILRREAEALREARIALRDAIDLQKFTQFLFFHQLDALRVYARKKNVKLFGDVPIFVSPDSADVWANTHLFLLDARTRRPKAVAGVPPDYFCKTGQRWGNPLYDWAAIKREGYRWWIERARASLRQVDLVRIDHFRGFVANWEVPASAKTAQKGRWVKGPGIDLFEALRNAIGELPFVAEDLGMITPDVHALRDALGLPGMLVLQFAFGGGADNPFLPHHHVRNAVVYTGTHDNDTTAGWFTSLDAKTKRHVRAFVSDIARDPAAALTRLAFSSVANIAIVPMQDLLSLGSKSRMNLPGSPRGNWGWRYRADDLTQERLDRLAEITKLYDRNARA